MKLHELSCFYIYLASIGIKPQPVIYVLVMKDPPETLPLTIECFGLKNKIF